jgi:hypothetical protein
MPSPFKLKDLTPTQKLHYYWIRLDDTTRGYFEQLYAKYPRDVSELLAGEALLPADGRKTLHDWVDGNGGGEALTASDFESVFINITEMKAEPQQLDSNQGFRVVWTGEATADFPEREDRLVFANQDGAEVRNMTLTYPAIKAGPVKEEIDCNPLPNGTYVVTLTVNVEGTDHGTQLTSQGIRSSAGVPIYVGDSDSAFFARLAPIIGEIQTKAHELAAADKFVPRNAQAIKELAQLAVDIDRPGQGDNPGPRAQAATNLAAYVDRLPTFDYAGATDEVLNAPAWAALRERLVGIVTLVNIEEVRTFQERLLSWLDAYTNTPG